MAAAAAVVPPQAGLELLTPPMGAAVPGHFTISGRQRLPVDPNQHVWLLIRAASGDGRLYPYPHEIVAGPDGTWKIEVDLGGPAGSVHELHLGVADVNAHVALLRHALQNPNEPLDSVPFGFWDEVTRAVVKR
jgi:hypothetical protein